MRDGWLNSLKRFILWDYPRASWQYDVMVVLILAFIFLTPRHYFRDQPKAKNIVMLQGENASNVFWIDPGLLEGCSEEERPARVEALIKAQSRGKRQRLIRVDPIFDSEDEIQGFMAFSKP